MNQKQKKEIKAIKRRKDYIKKKNIIKQAIKEIKNGKLMKGLPVKFPKSRKFKKKK